MHCVHIFAGLLLVCYAAAAEGPTATEFATRALPALPLEPLYGFRKVLSEGPLETLRRDPQARPSSSEMAIPGQGWTLVVPAGAGPVLRTAAEDFREYLERAMQVRVALETRPSLRDFAQWKNVIVAGVRGQMPGCGDELRGPKDYQLSASPARVAVCGFDERGAMYGLYNLEARMNLREAPFLPANLNTTRRSLYKARFTHSGLGWEQWPDKYLALLAHYGFDSVYASVYANPNGAPGFAPHYDRIRRQDPARTHDLIRRASRYGIDLYCPIIWRLDGTAENEQGLRKLIRDVATEFPEIRGYVLLIEGFLYIESPWRRVTDESLRDWIDHWTRGVAVAAEEFHKINPAIEVLPWDYQVNFHPDKREHKRYVIQKYPKDVIPLITYENGKGFERDGERGSLKDYALNEIGPAEGAALQIEEARRRNMPLYAKADTFATWQFGTFPYLPFPYQWWARYEALEKDGIAGTLETWSYGFKPNWMAELRAWNSWSDAPPRDELLRAVARREFGPGSEEAVLSAWDHFSKSVRLLPDTGPNMGTNNSIGSPFFFEKPQPRAMTVENSWVDQNQWMRDSSINPYWPYAPARVILWPDFTNKVNVAARYAQPFSLPVFQKYLLLSADEMEAGLKSYRAAALKAPERKRRGAFREVLLAEQIQRMTRSNQAILEFENLRFNLEKTKDRAQALDRMSVILKEEIARNRASLETQRRDSRLGYEWEQDYFYTPYVLEEKLKQLQVTLTELIPAYRKRMQ